MENHLQLKSKIPGNRRDNREYRNLLCLYVEGIIKGTPFLVEVYKEGIHSTINIINTEYP